MRGNLFAKRGSPAPLPKNSLTKGQKGKSLLYLQTVGARVNLAFATANGKVAKRRGGNEKHHSVVFEPHRDRAAARPAKTLSAKKVV